MINVVSASRLTQLGIKHDHSFTGVRYFKVSKFTQSQMARSYRHNSLVHLISLFSYLRQFFAYGLRGKIQLVQEGDLRCHDFSVSKLDRHARLCQMP